MRIPLSKIHFFLLNIVLLEMFLLGSGRILEFGPLTLRMVLYILCVFLSVLFLLCRPELSSRVFWLLMIFGLLISIGVLVGVFNYATTERIMEDLKPLMYFLMIVFFYLAIKKMKDLQRIASLVKLSSLILAAGYLSLLLLIYFNYISFDKLYILINTLSDDFFFRGTSGFFYKGFLFLCIGLIFYSLDKGLKNKIVSLLLLLAVLLTFTRGLILSLAFVFAFYILLIKRSYLAKALLIAICLISLPYLVEVYTSLLDNSNASNAYRTMQVSQVLERVTSFSIFFGHGFGIGVPIRPVHFEISFLEIFHKQGLIGLMFWVIFLGIIVHRYAKIRSYPYKKIALPFLLSSLFIYIQSQTNPFLNNPIGMSFLLISIISLKVVREEECRAYRYAWPHTTAKNISTPSLSQ